MQKLNRRVEVREPVQNPNSTTGGFDKKYTVKATVWAEFKPLSFGSRAEFIKAGYVRNNQVTEGPTHTFGIRKAPSLGVDFLGEDPHLGSDYYLWLFGRATGRGRLFRILGVVDKDERGELVTVLAMEEKEQETRGLFLNG